MNVRNAPVREALPRRVMIVVAYSIVIEGALYSAIAPIVPTLADRYDLSESMVGLIVSGYSGGLVAGSLASVLVIRRLRARNAAMCGLIALAIGTVVFAVAPTAEVVLAARVAQGLCAGLLWTSCTYWLLSAAPQGRRGQILGQTLSYTFVGTVAGPLLGTVAARIGIAPTYLAVALICATVAGWMSTAPVESADALEDLASTSGRRPEGEARGVAALSVGLVVLAGAVAGLLNTQGPIELDRRSMSDVAIGLVFVLAAVAAIVTGPLVGGVSDRLGAGLPVLTGLGAATCWLVLLSSGVANPHVYGAGAVGLTAAMFAFYLPAGAVLTVVSDQTSWSLPFALALSAVGWGVGETVGALLTGGLLEMHGARVTSVLAALAVGTTGLVTAHLLHRWRHFPGLRGPVATPVWREPDVLP